ncbi:polysaccharide deacetylase family protein [Priestia flexa]|uniref:DUF2334 domain-containing protein n=1 Tax=Priestia flexa TaxID=86664 RepID=UPI00203C2D25|nr:polysaccharide deacetylase family protein [Priestia flexa]MCM3067542.1 polysaccharide deacetylase family protein [Priestia flexa]
MKSSMGKQTRISKWWKKLFFLICVTLFTLQPLISTAVAKGEDEPKVLVIYTTKDGEINEQHRYLDMLIGHFASDIRFISSDEVEQNDLISVTHLFYYGQFSTKLPPKFLTILDDYDGAFVAIGYNSDMLGDQFDFLMPKHEVLIDQISLTSSNGSLDISLSNVVHFDTDDESEILINGRMKDEGVDYPVMVKAERNYYYAFDSFDSTQAILFAEMLHVVFEVDHEEKYSGYIRLEDVHPLVDPKPLREIAEILKEKNIPYMVAVIPIYTNQSTGRRMTFADSPQLLKVLKQIQKDGGSIVLHGYTHQFRTSETGEGFEFWDVENNRPIYAPEDQKLTLKDEQDFSSKKEYKKYISELKAYEREYTETKINKGIDELVKYGLYPLAFEAPHYTMSQHGYQILSEYFSTYVGQVQLSDKDWRIMDTSPYITSPSFLHGMELLPETMGYVRPDDPESVHKMMENTDRMGLIRDGMFAAFYHPYLGVERFQELIAELEELPNVSWIDLRERDIWVKGENVSIQTENGEIITEVNYLKVIFSSLDAPLYYLGRFVGYISFGIVFVGSVAVCMFIVFTIRLKRRNKQTEGGV